MSRNKQDAARCYAKSLSDDQLRGFDYDQERLDAKMIAEFYQLGHVQAASDILATIGNWKRFLPLVLNELNGKPTKSDLRTSGLNIIRAYIAVVAGDLDATRILHEVKTEYARLFVRERGPPNMTVRAWLASLQKCNKIPRDKSFQEVLKRYGASIRKDRRGRPARPAFR
jgi:hypothetical protein